MEITLQGIQLGGLEVRFYSLAILAGLFAGIALAHREARRLGENPDHVLNIAALGALLGIVGARLYHVFDQQEWPRYRDDPAAIFAVWNGGIGIFGAVAGAVAALLLYMYFTARVRPVGSAGLTLPVIERRRPPLRALRWLDIGAPAFLLGQAIGRWGNFFNQELFGKPTDLPWGISIPFEQVAAEAPAYAAAYLDGATRFHPLFLYESLLNLLGVAVLLFVARRFAHRLRPGDVLLLYLMWYPAVRFSLEFLRTNPWEQGGVPMAQIISVALFLGALATLIWRHRRPAPPEDALDAPTEPRSRAAQRRQRRRDA